MQRNWKKIIRIFVFWPAFLAILIASFLIIRESDMGSFENKFLVTREYKLQLRQNSSFKEDYLIGFNSGDRKMYVITDLSPKEIYRWQVNSPKKEYWHRATVTPDKSLIGLVTESYLEMLDAASEQQWVYSGAIETEFVYRPDWQKIVFLETVDSNLIGMESDDLVRTITLLSTNGQVLKRTLLDSIIDQACEVFLAENIRSLEQTNINNDSCIRERADAGKVILAPAIESDKVYMYIPKFELVLAYEVEKEKAQIEAVLQFAPQLQRLDFAESLNSDRLFFVEKIYRHGANRLSTRLKSTNHLIAWNRLPVNKFPSLAHISREEDLYMISAILEGNGFLYSESQKLLLELIHTGRYGIANRISKYQLYRSDYFLNNELYNIH